MIRINLLPQAAKTKAAAAPATPAATQAWAVAYFVAALVWVVALVGIYMYYDGILSEQLSTNQGLSRQIEQLRQRSTQLEEVEGKIQQSQQLQQLVDELNRARMGPARLMIEMSNILTPRKGPRIDPQQLEQLRRDNPLAGFNESWDPKRLWIAEFKEEAAGGQRSCEISGVGKSNEDVAEFLRRLALSEIFTQVTLERTESTTDAETGLQFISFSLSCQVQY